MLDLSAHPDTAPLRIALGAGEQRWPGWIPTHKEDLDLTNAASWDLHFHRRKADAFLCEHVWEHLTESEGRAAAALCFRHLAPGGYVRCAVPDRYFPDPNYQAMVRAGGPGPVDHPAADHKLVYDYRLLSEVFTSAGFVVDLLEYCDENGRFHYHQWSSDDGPIYRSLMLDHRNRDGRIGFISLILDARKR